MARSEQEDPRRRFLVSALASGFFALAWPSARSARAQILGRRPRPLPPGQSIYEMTGAVTVNGKRIGKDARILPGDRIETEKGGQLIFVVGADAFIMRPESSLQTEGSGVLLTALRLASGALLSVFGSGPKQIYGPTATIGIRGTGLYLESEPDRTYVCACYGEVDIAAIDDPSIRERIVSTHHDAPRYVVSAGARIRPAPFKNHSDLELMLIESLVGRVPPFALFDETYGAPRRY
jgi:hypothetical protein